MNKKKTLVRVPLKEEYFNNKMNEKALYLMLPSDHECYCVEEDIKKGGIQFNSLVHLIKKKKISRIITLSADSEEMGLMAVAYLAMDFIVKRGGIEEDLAYGFEDDGTFWTEDEWKIPIISLNDIVNYMRNYEPPVESGGYLMAQAQSRNVHQPYWRSCLHESVCILVKRMDIDADYMEYINVFAKNRNVFVVFLEKDSFANRMIEELPFGCMDIKHFQALKNNFVLSNASDTVTVSFGESDGKLYYKNVLKQNFKQRGIRVCKDFSYERLVNLASSIDAQSVCKMLDKIIDYALKDVENLHTMVMKNQNFDFVDQFMREQSATGKEESGQALMENNLVGMEQIKQQVYDVVNVMRYHKLRRQMNIRGSHFHNVHMMLGAPGTAKTTVARYMGKMMFDEKLLSDNRFICMNGAEMKGKYVGHSAPKIKELFEKYDVIIIDEAYSIVEADGNIDSFGNEAIAQLIIELEKHSTDKLIIFAGYGGRNVDERDNKMSVFLDANPGIKSRITSTFFFDSYTADEMVQIFMRIAGNGNYKVQPSAAEIVKDFFAERVNDRAFGNGREARALLENAVLFAARRMMVPKKEQYTAEELITLSIEDVKAAIEKMRMGFGMGKSKHRQIGFKVQQAEG